MADEKETAVWIKTDPSFDGKTFVVTVEIDEDRAIVLDREGCLEYGYAILSAVQHAEYDAAVMKQLTSMNLEPETALQVVLDMRADRPPINMGATAPLAVVPGVNKDHKAFLQIRVDGVPIGQWTLEDARTHALTAIEAHIAADLDSVYLKELKGLVGLSDEKSRSIIANLAEHRPT